MEIYFRLLRKIYATKYRHGFFQPENAYAISKINAENSHRVLTNLSVIDIRIFSYLSDEIDINSSFLFLMSEGY